MKKVLILSLLGFLVLILSIASDSQEPLHTFHTPTELAVLRDLTSSRTPIGPGEWFLSSYSCRGCHGHDTTAQANIDENGNDVNLVSHWESSMMALASKDPLWRAKVSQEILINPPHEGPLQDKCTSCHAPSGRYNHFFHGNQYYRLSDIVNDTLGLDGVNCVSCHAIDSLVGSSFSGVIPYDTTRKIYGPFTLPEVGPMQLYEGYTPTYSTHTDQSRMCSSCHTLITETADLNGNLTGGEFIEQATYHEYLNSSFPSNNIKCQTCHMPQLSDPVVIANGFIALQPRYPFNQHVFAGANSFMLNLIRNNKQSLGVQVEDGRFDSTIQATTANLMLNSVDMSLSFDSAANDTGYFRVRLQNKVGHKFPSGYPARRSVLQFVIQDAVGDTIFKSGIFDADGRVVGETPAFEPHHDFISQSDIPQIYELVMGDVNGNFTSVLERAAIQLKDNRLPPAGFTTQHSAYDTVQISADALADPDFNKTGIVEGSGADEVHYHVPMQQVNGAVKVTARLYYQSVPPKWLDEMFQLNSAEIDSFRIMYQAADKTPVTVQQDSLNLVITGNYQVNISAGITVYPTVSTDGKFSIKAGKGTAIVQVEMFDLSGKKVLNLVPSFNGSEWVFNYQGNAGAYLVRVLTNNGIFTRKILKRN